MLARISLLVAVFLVPLDSSAQPLADKVPADAIFYVGWAGADSLGEGYEGSHLEAVMEASNFRSLFSEFAPNLLRKLAEQEPDAEEPLALLSALAGPMWKHPSAFYFAGLDTTNPRRPIPRMGYLILAGDQAQPMAQSIQKVLPQGDTPVPFHVAAYGDLLVVTTQQDAATDALFGGPAGVAPAESLSQSDAFAGTLKQVHTDPVTIVYADAVGVMKLIDQAVEQGRDAEARQMWPKLRDAAGLGGLKQFAYTGAFDGKDWSSRAFLAAPAPRSGLVAALLDPTPVSDELLKRVPKSAAMVGAATFDLADMLDATRQAVEQVDPAAADQIDQGLTMAGGVVGMDLETQLLATFGRQWAYYLDPETGGFYGIVMLNQLADAEAAEKGLAHLGDFASRMIRHQSGGKITIGTRKLEYDGQTIHYLSAPIVAPAWTIKDGTLYVALFPQTISTAVAGSTAGDSILENESFTQFRSNLSGKPAASLNYVDVPTMLPRLYDTWLMVSQYAGMSEVIGVETPAMILPPMHKLLPHAAPAATVSWVDDGGWHLNGRSAFPGSRLLAGDASMTIGGTALGVSILLPSLNRAREQANRVGCASNMRQIGLAILMYAGEKKGVLPPDLGSLLPVGLSPEVFVCYSSGNEVPPDLKNAPLEEQARWVNENSDYVYVNRDLSAEDLDPETVLVFEHLENHGGDGANVLYGDGHVEFLSIEQALDKLEPFLEEETVPLEEGL